MSKHHPLQPIPVAVAGLVNDKQSPPCALFLPGAQGKEPVLYRDAGTETDEPNFVRLAESGVTHLLVSGDTLVKCERALEDNLHDLLQDPRIEPSQKAACAQHVGISLARDLTTMADMPAQLARASDLLDSVIEGVLADPLVAANLLQMCGHHRSTASHMFAVSTLAVLVGAEVMGSDARQLNEIGMAGMLHDLGKMRIDPAILNKVKPLTPQEIQIIQHHPVESIRMVGDDPTVTPRMRQMILQHHERIDGCGYPLGLPGSELLVGSRILAIVDSFHAMIGRRAYRPDRKPSQAVEMLRNASGTQFDSDLFRVWEKVFERCWKVTMTRAPVAPSEAGVSGSFHSDHRTAPSRNISRRLARLLCRGEAKVRCVYAGRLNSSCEAPDSFDVELHDLSRGGLCMRLAHPMYRGEVVHVLIQSQQQKAWVRGIVRWCRRSGRDAQYKAGIMFTQRIADDDVPTKVAVRAIDDTTLFNPGRPPPQAPDQGA